MKILQILIYIDKFFNASSIAVIGASPTPGRLGHTILNNLKTNGYKGRLYPVNPKYDSILDLKSYPDIASVKGKCGPCYCAGFA